MERKKKRKWMLPSVTRIRLNPEQAVLGCCSVASGKGFVIINKCCSGMFCAPIVSIDYNST